MAIRTRYYQLKASVHRFYRLFSSEKRGYYVQSKCPDCGLVHLYVEDPVDDHYSLSWECACGCIISTPKFNLKKGE